MQGWEPIVPRGKRVIARLGMLIALGAMLLARTASADDIRVLLEGASTEKLPFLKTYVTLVDGDGKPVRSKSGYKLFQDTVEQKELQITAVKDGGQWLAGIELISIESRQRQGFMPALRLALHQPLTLTWLNLKGFVDIFRGRQKADFKSPVGIIRIMKEQLSRGAAEGLQFVAMISTLLGFFNLMPLPALDGGRLVFLGWELVTRRPVNQRVEQIVHLVGMILLLGLLLLLVVKDLRDWIFGH